MAIVTPGAIRSSNWSSVGLVSLLSRRPVEEVVRALRELVGSRLTAYVTSQRRTETIGSWVDGTVRPSVQTEERLRLSLEIAELLARVESADVISAGFMGLNPDLGDLAAATILRTNDPADVRDLLLSAARAIAAE